MADLNLYQLIGVTETASVQEIENAAVNKYNEARNLINHYDQNIANNANQTLHLVENARTILLNPQKKAEYDQSLGISASIGGLADPAQYLGKFSPVGAQPVSLGMGKSQTVQTLQPGQTQNDTMEQLVALNAWVCDKCKTPNQKGTKFCKKCGNAVGINCPNCGKLIEASAERCTECGVSLKQVIKQMEAEGQANAAQIEENMRMQPFLIEMQKQSNTAMSMSSFWWIIFAWIGLILWIVAYSKAVNVLNMQYIDSATAVQFRETAIKARSRAKTNIIVMVCLIGLTLLISLIASNS